MDVDLHKFRSECMNAHNAYRSVHGAEPLMEDTDLNAYAQDWAEKMLRSSNFSHSYGDNGENIAYRMQSKAPTGKEMTDMWYSEEKDYNYDTGRAKHPGLVIGHFTQVVWKGTQYAGFGLACNDRRCYAVGSYKDPGNYSGRYREHVGPKTGEPDFSESAGEEPAEEEKVEEDDEDDNVEDDNEDEETEENTGENAVRNERGGKKPNQLPRTVMKAFRRRFERKVNRFRENQQGLRRDKEYQKLAQKSANAIIKQKRRSDKEPKKVLHWTTSVLEAELYNALMSDDFTAIGIGVSCPSADGDEKSYIFVYLG